MVYATVEEVRCRINNALDAIDGSIDIGIKPYLNMELLDLNAGVTNCINDLLAMSGSEWEVMRMFPESVTQRVAFDLYNETTGLNIELRMKGKLPLGTVLPILLTIR